MIEVCKVNINIEKSTDHPSHPLPAYFSLGKVYLPDPAVIGHQWSGHIYFPVSQSAGEMFGNKIYIVVVISLVCWSGPGCRLLDIVVKGGI